MGDASSAREPRLGTGGPGGRFRWWPGAATIAVIVALTSGCSPWRVAGVGEEVRYEGRRVVEVTNPDGAMVREEEEITSRLMRLRTTGAVLVETSPPRSNSAVPARILELFSVERGGRFAPDALPWGSEIVFPPGTRARAVPEDLHPHVQVPSTLGAPPKNISLGALSSEVNYHRLEGGRHPLAGFPPQTRLTHELLPSKSERAGLWELHRTIADPLPMPTVDRRGTIVGFDEIFVLNPLENRVLGYRRRVALETPGPDGPVRRVEVLELNELTRRRLGPAAQSRLERHIADIRRARKLISEDLDAAEAHLRTLLAQPTESPLLDVVRLYESAIRHTRERSEEDRRRARFRTLLSGDHVRPAPEISGVDLDGRRVSLHDLRGNVVLLSFWASW